MKKQRNMLVAGLVLGLMVSCTQAAVIINIQQDGNNVLMSGSGSFNLASLEMASQAVPYSVIRADSAWVGVGNVGSNLQHYMGLDGPETIGSGTDYFLASSTTGDNFTVNYYSITVPLGYISEEELSGTATFNDTTVAGLGLTEGTYMWTWGAGETADSVTLNVVPEPATMSLLALGGMALLRRKKK